MLVLENSDYAKASSKDLDIFLQRLEQKLESLIYPSSYSRVFNRVGEHNEPRIYLFAMATKTVCTVKTNLYLPKDKSVKQATTRELQEILKDSKECTDPKKPSNSLNNLSKTDPAEFQFENEIRCNEGNERQLKCFSLAGRKGIRWKEIRKYISAFGNVDGGEIILGVSDNGIVVGERMEETSFVEVETKVESIVNEMYWGYSPERGIHWDVDLFQVEGCPTNSPAVVIVVYVAGMKNCGGVFCKAPESYNLQVGTDHKEDLCALSFEEWKQKILPDRDWPKEYQGL